MKKRPWEHGGVAQLGEHLPCKQGVMGSNPIISTSAKLAHPRLGEVQRGADASNPDGKIGEGDLEEISAKSSDENREIFMFIENRIKEKK